jgi:ubiquinone/menaquinone biosynthesis C-methylase UbiE
MPVSDRTNFEFIRNKASFNQEGSSMQQIKSETFDAMVSSWERYGEPLTIQFAREALSRSGGVTRGETLIDMGAGTGALALEAAKAGAKVLAIDIAPAMIARLNERLVSYPGNEARVMNGESLDLTDNSFAAGFSVFAATCMPDWHQALSELVRVVKVGGRVVVTHWSDPTGFAGPSKILAEVFSEVFAHNKSPLSSGISCVHTSESLRKDMTDAGCENIRVEEVNVTSTWPDPNRLVDELEPIFRFLPAYAALNDTERTHMKGPLTEAFAAHTAADGTVQLPEAAFIAIGNKRPSR